MLLLILISLKLIILCFSNYNFSNYLKLINLNFYFKIIFIQIIFKQHIVKYIKISFYYTYIFYELLVDNIN